MRVSCVMGAILVCSVAPLVRPSLGFDGNVSDGIEELQIAADGYLHNRESFRYIHCKYRIRFGTADTAEAAQTRGPAVVEVVLNGTWTVRDESTSLVLANLDKADTAAPGSSSWSICDNRHLTDGKLHLAFYGPMNGGSIMPVESAVDGIDGTPFDLWCMGKNEEANPGRLIQLILAQPRNKRTTALEIIETKPFLRFGTRPLDFPGQQQIEYVLDPKRGYALVDRILTSRHTDAPEASIDRVKVTDLRECSSRRWFPMRAVQFEKYPATGKFQVREFLVDELDVETRPTDSMLAIELPKAALINDLRSGGSQIELAEPWTIDVGTLGKIYQKTQDAVKITRKAEDAERAHVHAQDRAAERTLQTELKRGSRVRPLVIGFNAAVLAIAAIAFWWRRRSRT